MRLLVENEGTLAGIGSSHWTKTRPHVPRELIHAPAGQEKVPASPLAPDGHRFLFSLPSRFCLH
jgi:hypothetical protein